jgi:uncharacterized Zn-finger protein
MTVRQMEWLLFYFCIAIKQFIMSQYIIMFNICFSFQAHDRSDGRPYTCEVCSMSFSRRGNLERHALLHDGVRPHVCPVCNKAHATAYNLKEHLMIHSGERPHICDKCNTSFRRISHLARHKHLHTH